MKKLWLIDDTKLRASSGDFQCNVFSKEQGLDFDF